MLDLEPVLVPVRIDDLHPTQMTVGYREVARKRREWRELADRDGASFLGRHQHVVAELGKLEGRQFTTFMDNKNWLHPFDDEGHRRELKHLPKHVSKLADDPYRSLAGELRRAGGYAKDQTPYSEFLWADFLRRHIKRNKVETHFEGAVAQALEIAHLPRASYLPGWAGPHH